MEAIVFDVNQNLAVVCNPRKTRSFSWWLFCLFCVFFGSICVWGFFLQLCTS